MNKFLIASALLALSSQANATALKLELSQGKGEFANVYKTTSKTLKASISKGRFDVGIKHVKLNSVSGAIDDSMLSLIEGDYTFGCIGYKLSNNTRVSGCVNNKLWELESKFTSDPMLYGIQVGAGVAHGNARGMKRKTTKAILSLERKIGYGFTAMVRASTGNNTISTTNDQIEGVLLYTKEF